MQRSAARQQSVQGKRPSDTVKQAEQEVASGSVSGRERQDAGGMPSLKPEPLHCGAERGVTIPILRRPPLPASGAGKRDSNNTTFP
jgi:hypothetical protein